MSIFFSTGLLQCCCLIFLEGFTAFLVTRLPQRACDLADSTLDSLKPAEGVDFQKRLVPIFKGDAAQYLHGLKGQGIGWYSQNLCVIKELANLKNNVDFQIILLPTRQLSHVYLFFHFQVHLWGAEDFPFD